MPIPLKIAAMAIMIFLAVFPVPAAAELKSFPGFVFDTDTRELFAEDGLTRIDKGSFRSFPDYPTEKGLKKCKDLFEAAVGKGFEFHTKVSRGPNGPVLLVDVFGKGEKDRGIEPLVQNWPFGKTLELKFRHRSDQSAILSIRTEINSRR